MYIAVGLEFQLHISTKEQSLQKVSDYYWAKGELNKVKENNLVLLKTGSQMLGVGKAASTAFCRD